MHCRIGETNIICTDLERSLRFYRDLLGFEALEPEGPAWHLACDGRKFLLLGVAGRSREPTPYCEVAEFSLDLLVDDLREAKRRFEAAGVQFVSEFEPSADRFFIRDPDGLVLEIIQAANGDG
jgi:catechol 2,3-dioxygenase-like lactoylglutathione lyase family enzyme